MSENTMHVGTAHDSDPSDLEMQLKSLSRGQRKQVFNHLAESAAKRFERRDIDARELTRLKYRALQVLDEADRTTITTF